MLAFYRLSSILGLKSIPGDSNDKDTAAMFVELSTEANEESFIHVQHDKPQGNLTFYLWLQSTPL